MRIEHAALFVADLEGARDFFIRYFGARAGELYCNRENGFRSYFLSFDGGARLELMLKPGMAAGAGEALGWSHVAFSLGSRTAVDELTARLQKDGYTVVSGPRTTGDGYYESCVEVFGGQRIELTI